MNYEEQNSPQGAGHEAGTAPQPALTGAQGFFRSELFADEGSSRVAPGILAGAYCLLSIFTGISVAYAFSWSLWLGFLGGVVLGLLPILAPPLGSRMGRDYAASRVAETVSLSCVVIIGLTFSVQTMLPLMDGAGVQILGSMPVLLMTAAQYGVYLLLHAQRRATERASALEALSTLFAVPPMLLTLAMAVILATYALLLIQYLGNNYAGFDYFSAKFLDRGIIPPITVTLFFWGLLLLMNKWWLLLRERRALSRQGGPGRSILTNIWQRLAREGGGMGPGDYLDIVWKKSADFYTIPRYINWAIPILGFIGTVLGISLAADGIQSIISSQSSVSELSTELGQAIAPLGIAFDTTLIALSLSVFLMLLQTALQRWEDQILIDYESWVRSDHGGEGGGGAGVGAGIGGE